MTGYLRLNKILKMLNGDDSIENNLIIIQPTENTSWPVSDENSGEEDGGIVNHLPGSMLRALALLVHNVDSVIEDSPYLSEQKLSVDLNASSFSKEPLLASNPSLGASASKSTGEQPPLTKKKRKS